MDKLLLVAPKPAPKWIRRYAKRRGLGLRELSSCPPGQAFILNPRAVRQIDVETHEVSYPLVAATD